MGIISDYLEQTKDHHGGLEAQKFFSNPKPVIILNSKCPLCGKEFITESDVHQHILTVHRDHQQYVKVNDVIVNDFYYCEKVNSIEAICIDNCGCRIMLELEGRSIPLEKANMNERYITYIPATIITREADQPLKSNIFCLFLLDFSPKLRYNYNVIWGVLICRKYM